MTAGSPVPDPKSGGPFERDGAGTAAVSSAAVRAGVFLSVSDSGSGQDGSGDLRARLAGLVRQPFEGWVSSPTEAYADAVADAVLADGFRRVVEDDATIERVAEALHARNCDCTAWSDKDLTAARAAVRALREETA